MGKISSLVLYVSHFVSSISNLVLDDTDLALNFNITSFFTKIRIADSVIPAMAYIFMEAFETVTLEYSPYKPKLWFCYNITYGTIIIWSLGR